VSVLFLQTTTTTLTTTTTPPPTTAATTIKQTNKQKQQQINTNTLIYCERMLYYRIYLLENFLILFLVRLQRKSFFEYT